MRSRERIERSRVRAAFHRTAAAYDRHAAVQRRVIERFLDMLRAVEVRPRRMLDIGSGTGLLLARLHARYPGALAIGVDLALGMCRRARDARSPGPGAAFLCGDAERLPLADAAFDLAVSTSVFQWLPSLESAFAEVFRVLEPGGLFSFTLFGGKTLFELKQSYRQALGRRDRNGQDRLLATFSSGGVRTALAGAGFREYLVRTEAEVEHYPDVPDLLRALKRTGTGSTVPPAGFAERRVLLKMMEIYRARYGREGAVPATYEVIWAAARK